MILLSDIKKNKYNFGLYVVSTPIGNLGDITLRAIDILKQSEFILCEDTRVSKKILDKYKIKSKLISNHKFNEMKNVSKIIELIKSEKIISIISDAGTPMISDPGKIIVNACIKNKINIYPMPGPSAVTSAISISGFSEKYFFYGFFPQKQKDLLNDLEKLSNIESAIVFFISPNKINKAIENIKKYFSGRKILICREMTKFYEEYIRTAVDDLKPLQEIPKGELTLVISENISQLITLSESDKKNIKKMIQNLSIKDIINLITKEKKNTKKRDIQLLSKFKKMKLKFINIIFIFLFFTSCIGTSSQGIFGTGVSIAFDPRSIGTQIDDSIMQKNLSTRLAFNEKSYILSISTKVLDGRIFLTGKVNNPEEKLQITKLAWETKGVRSVKNDIKIKEKFNFKQSAKDLLITSQLRAAIIFNKKIKATNYQIDTYKKKIYVYGIALNSDERKEVINEAKEILDVEDVIASIMLVEDLRIQKD